MRKWLPLGNDRNGWKMRVHGFLVEVDAGKDRILVYSPDGVLCSAASTEGIDEDDQFDEIAKRCALDIALGGIEATSCHHVAAMNKCRDAKREIERLMRKDHDDGASAV